MVYISLTIEHRINKHVGIVYSKSFMFNEKTYYYERIYSRIIRIGVIICQSNLFIQADTVVDVILNSLAVTFLT